MSEDLSDILLKTPPMLRLDEADERDHQVVLGERVARADIDEMLGLPGLEEFVAGPSNQGRVSSCAAHSATNGTDALLTRYFQTDPREDQFSAEGAYNAWRQMAGRLDEDSGLTMRECMKGLKERGLVSERVWTPDDPHQPPPEDYDRLSIKYTRGYYVMPQVTDQGGRFPVGTNYSLRAWLQHIKVERLPIFVATKIPHGDMRSSYVRDSGFRSVNPYRSHDDPGYWHAECAVNIIRVAELGGSRIYVKVIGSWGLVGDQGYFYIPWDNFLSSLYANLCFAPKKALA